MCASAYLYILLILTDWWGTNDYRDALGWALVILVLITLSINSVNLAYSTGKAAFKLVKKKCMKKGKKSDEKFEEEPPKEIEPPP